MAIGEQKTFRPPPPPPSSSINPISDLRRLLGEPIVFIRCKKNGKEPVGKWGHLTVADMTPQHLASLKGFNVGVSLGEASGGLCVIDIDEDNYVEPFLALNPSLANTFRTHGARGCGFWIRIKDNCPKYFELETPAGSAAIEFRSHRHYSVAWGTHPDTKQLYQWVVKKPAIEVEFESIRWPDDLRDSRRGNHSPEGELFEGEKAEGNDSEGSRPYNCEEGVRVCPEVAASAAHARPNAGLSIDEHTRGEIDRAVEFGVKSTRQNNEASFRACLFLIQIKGVEDLSGISQAERIYFAEAWYRSLSAKGRTTKFKTHYFNDIFSSMKNAKRSDSMNEKNPVPTAWELAQSHPLPPEATMFEGDEIMQRLIGLCFQIHRLRAGGEWFLARNKVGELMGLDTNATRNLSENFTVLVNCGILEVVAAHDKTKRQATTYRYVEQGPLSCGNQTEEQPE